jgi:hypothetical protein
MTGMANEPVSTAVVVDQSVPDEAAERDLHQAPDRNRPTMQVVAGVKMTRATRSRFIHDLCPRGRKLNRVGA